MNKIYSNPPSSGSLAGYLVASNFSAAVPPGVTKTGNTAGNYEKGQNTLSPRIGFSWQKDAQAESKEPVVIPPLFLHQLTT